MHQQIYFTRAEAANYTRLSLRSIDYARERGELRAFRVGKKVLFAREDLDRFIRAGTIGADLDKMVDETVAELLGGQK